jgi:fructan beta-fructosidase
MKRLFYFVVLLVVIYGCNSRSYKNPHSSPGFPAVHFTSSAKWLGEPVSLVFQKGIYHLFYKTSDTAYGTAEIRQATSDDLIHWKENKEAVSAGKTINILYGSFVNDIRDSTKENPGKNPLKALLLVKSSDGKKDSVQFILVTSKDSGNHWEIIKEKIEFPGKIEKSSKTTIIWDNHSGKCIMTWTKFNDIDFFSSTDLITWKAESTFSIPELLGSTAGERATLCPTADSDKYILLVEQAQGGPNGGSGTQYFIGGFDGQKFTNQSKKIHKLDYGRDNYYNVACSGLSQTDKRNILIGWMNNLEYSYKEENYPWCGSMTFPREIKPELTYGEWLIKSSPVNEIQKISKQTDTVKNRTISGEVNLNDHIALGESPIVLSLNFSTDEMTRMTFPARFGIRLENKKGESLILGYDVMSWWYFIDRSGLAFSKSNPRFGGIQMMPCYHSNTILSMNMIIDNSSIELFTEGGKLVMTENYLPEAKFSKIILFTDNGNIHLIDGKITRLESIYDK